MRVFRQIDSVPASLWDKAAGRRLGFDRRLLKVMEAAGGQQPVYFLKQHADGENTIASGTEYLDATGSNPLSDLMLGRFDGRLPWLGSAFRPVLVIRSRFTHRSGIVTSAASSREAWRYIEEFVVDLAAYADRERQAIMFMDIEGDEIAAPVLHRLRCLEIAGRPVARLAVGWAQWSDYLDAAREVSANAASTIRSEVNRASREGVRIAEWEPSRTPETRLRELYDDHHYRLNAAPLRYQSGFFSSLKGHLGSDASVLVAHRGNTLVGSSFILASGPEAVLPLVGVDHSAARGSFTYFNLAFYEPVRRAMAEDRRLLTMGPGALGAEIRRGCTIEAPRVFWRPATAAVSTIGVPVARAQRIAMRRKFRAELSSRPFSIPAAD